MRMVLKKTANGLTEQLSFGNWNNQNLAENFHRVKRNLLFLKDIYLLYFFQRRKQIKLRIVWKLTVAAYASGEVILRAVAYSILRQPAMRRLG